jgi:hypothetical protein
VLADGSDVAAEMALAHGQLAWLASERGEIAVARSQVEIGLHAAHRAAQEMLEPQDDLYEIQLSLVAASIHATAHDTDRRREALQQALRLVQPNRHQRVYGSCLEFLAELALELCDADVAARHIEEFDALARVTGVAIHGAKVCVQRAELALLVGDLEEALRQATTAELEYTRIGSRSGQAASLVRQAEALARAGETSASRTTQLRALQLHESNSALVEARISRLLIAETWRAEGELSRALAVVRAELADMRQMHSLGVSNAALSARMGAYRILAAAAEPDAAQQLELAMSELEGRLGSTDGPSVRARLLEGRPLHREIAAGWQARGT